MVLNSSHMWRKFPHARASLLYLLCTLAYMCNTGSYMDRLDSYIYITPHMHRILFALQFNVLTPHQDTSSSDVARQRGPSKVRFSDVTPMKERDEKASCDSRSYDNGGQPAPSTSSTTDHGAHLAPSTSSTTDHGGHLAPYTSSTTDHGAHLAPSTSSTTDHGAHSAPSTSSTTDHGAHLAPSTSSTTDHGDHPAPSTSSTTDHGGHSPPSTSSTTDHGLPEGRKPEQSSGDASAPSVRLASQDRSILARPSVGLRSLIQLPLADIARARMARARRARATSDRASARHSQTPPRKPFPCVASCFKVTRRHRDPILDNISKVAFPTCFVIFNVIYWCFYTL